MALTGIEARMPSHGPDDGGCLVRRSLNEPMRNLALAHLLLNDGEADRVIYALFAPHAHIGTWRRFGELRAAFPDTSRRTIKALLRPALRTIPTVEKQSPGCTTPTGTCGQWSADILTESGNFASHYWNRNWRA
jgi:hypothetical protein